MKKSSAGIHGLTSPMNKLSLKKKNSSTNDKPKRKNKKSKGERHCSDKMDNSFEAE